MYAPLSCSPCAALGDRQHSVVGSVPRTGSHVQLACESKALVAPIPACSLFDGRMMGSRQGGVADLETGPHARVRWAGAFHALEADVR